jgi:hypothetical protein
VCITGQQSIIDWIMQYILHIGKFITTINVLINKRRVNKNKKINRSFDASYGNCCFYLRKARDSKKQNAKIPANKIIEHLRFFPLNIKAVLNATPGGWSC